MGKQASPRFHPLQLSPPKKAKKSPSLKGRETVEEFVARGGKIQHFALGVTGIDYNKPPRQIVIKKKR